MTDGIEGLAVAIEQQVQAIRALAEALERNTEAVMLLVHGVAELLGEEMGEPVKTGSTREDEPPTNETLDPDDDPWDA